MRSPALAAPGAPREDALLDLLALHLATVYQPGLGRELVRAFGCARSVLAARRGALLSAVGARGEAAGRILSPRARDAAASELARSRELGVEILAPGTAGFPAMLEELPGMPLVLFARGDAARADALSQAAVGIVGSRRPTPYGVAQARRFAAGLAGRGLTVTSGLALGIDGEAHRAALDAGGATIAVLGSGLGRVYPAAHRDLAARIARGGGGVVLSEFPCDASPRTFHFPLRNRILSALSRAVLVVEAGEKSGSLITVTHALEQGRTVYALPGRVDRPESLGCLRLLFDGASPVITPDDVLPGVSASPQGAPARGIAPGKPPGPSLPGRFGPELSSLFAAEDVWGLDALAERLAAPIGEILAELGRLELDGHLQRTTSGAYARG